MIINYRLTFSDTNRITVSDPSELDLPLYPAYSRSTSGLLDIHLERVALQYKRWVDVDDRVLPSGMQQSMRFYSLTTLYKDLALQQGLYCATLESSISPHLEPPSWKRKLLQTMTKMPKNNFLVDDDDLSLLDCEALPDEPVSSYVRRRREQATSISSGDWTVNYELTVQQLNNVGVSEVTDLDETLEEARVLLQGSNVDDVAPMRTLRELTEGEATVRDIEEASTRLQELLSTQSAIKPREQVEKEDEWTGPAVRLAWRTIQMPSALRLFRTEGSDRLSFIHKEILRDWIMPLPDSVPDLARLAKEQLARRMAAEVALASHVLRSEEPREEQPSQSQSQSQSQAWELPVRPTAAPLSSRATPSEHFDDSSQPPHSTLPTSSASATPSVITASSHPSTFSAPENTRLSRYTTFSKRTPPPLPRSLNKVLAHWIPGADPSNYDWLATSRNLSRRFENEEKGEEMTEKERMRMQRRTERYVRRQRREAAESQWQQMLSSQAPEIISARQPQQAPILKVESQQTGMDATAGSSQSFGYSQAVASQVLPGRHGGRPPARKKRKSGF